MIRFDAWFLPDGETHLQQWMSTVGQRVDGRLTYQYHKYAAALELCRNRRRAVDVGSHVGLWAYWMARDFAQVDCFEPHPEHRSCWRRNLADRQNAELFAYALGPTRGSIALKTGPSSSGDTYVDPAGVGEIPLWPLDAFEGLRDVDFLKVDAEGYELFILQGARETLQRNRPVVCVEQKPGHGRKYAIGDTAGVTLLESWGYRQAREIAGDVILVPGEWV